MSTDPYNPPGQDDQASPMELLVRVHRLMRGRYVVAIMLSVLLGGSLAAAGWLLPVPAYTAVGTLEFAPTREGTFPEEDSEPIPFFRDYVYAEASKLLQGRPVEMALADPKWSAAVKRHGKPFGEKEFRGAVDVRVQGANNRLVDVSFTHEDASLAQAGANALVDAYIAIRKEADNREQAKVDAARDVRDAAQRALDELVEQRRALRLSTPGDLDSEIEAIQRRLLELRSQKSMYQAEIDAMAQRPGGEAAPPDDLVLAQLSPDFADLLSLRAEEEDVLAALRAGGLGEQHHDVRASKRRMEQLEQRIDAKRQELLGMAEDQPDGQDVVASPDRLTAQIEAIDSEIDERRQQLDGLEQIRDREADIQYQIGVARSKVTEAEERLDRYERQKEATGAQLVESYPATPPLRPSTDNRKKYAVLGLFAGAGAPIGLFLLLGALDRRFRYADDAIVGPATPLLGILPKLPRKIRDPEQASIAAHCVHQIRTLLQIGSGDCRALVVTSPTAGDGKTSLVISLGLSFANAGKRTILVDLDLVGMGLTHALEMAPEAGAVAALEAGGLNGHVAETWVPNLYVLPAGVHDAQGISRLTPERVRTLLECARREFDVVLVDTGPVLGSLEASLSVTEADGVLLAVRRGQKREMAQKAIEYIRSLNGSIVGMIFNQATLGDFRRAVSSASVRSRPMTSSELRKRVKADPSHTVRLGPMPGALVATSEARSDSEKVA